MRLTVIFFLVPFLVTACVAPTKQEAAPSAAVSANQADDYLAAGDYNAAAEEYIRLAEKNKKNADSLLLQAASAYLSGNNQELANATLSRIKPGNLSGVQAMEYKILYARLALDQNQPDSALHLLEFSLPADISRPLASDYYMARGRAQEMNGQLLNAARSRVQLAVYLETDDEVRNNNHAIWGLLTQLNAADLRNELAGADSELSGWLELAIIAGTLLHSRPELDIALNEWKQRYGAHPAGAQIIPELHAAAADTVISPRRIAILLPFNAQYHDAATAIRDGFVAAWYATPVAGGKPSLRIYNTSLADIMTIYNRAVADGADFIVGPLEKEAVTTLLANANMPVRVLALNQASTNPGHNTATVTSTLPSIFQFGLLPEDETYQAADRAWFNGHANALIITHDTNWGERVYNAFSSHWQQLGGKIVEHVKIPDPAEDLALPVKELLNIDKSEARAKELSGILGKKIQFEPRHRRDADLIFMAAPPVLARQIIPQFRYFGENTIPIYSISGVYSGIHNIEADNDINDVVFADMPWIVDPERENLSLQQMLNRNWGQNDSLYKRFYALGIDAYHIIPELAALFLNKHGNYNGVTGLLTVNKDGHVQRTSTWVHIVKGVPQLLDREPVAQ
ncbi:MAG: penicillin-binding protein activator [Gammaproteobacteria bacterium]